MTIKFIYTPLLAFAAATAGCTTMAGGDGETVGAAALSRSDGAPAGAVELVRRSGQLYLVGALAGLPSGQHGFHLHTTGRCDAPDFQSAGGHLNPYNRDHGKLDPQGKHLGDLNNITVSGAGTASINQLVGADAASDLAKIFDGDGTSVMVHSGADDYRTDPSGDAGSRIACGVMRGVG